jgi:uncharacterized protein YbbK (DUF523 family)
MSEILIGVSACLLGEQVRHDGGHKRNAFLLEELASHVRFVPICPEVAIGLGAPRETVRLVRRSDGIRLLGSAGVDHTDAMRRWAGTVLGELCEQELSGFVLKKGSPSCGLERVRVWDESVQRPSRQGRGVFAKALVDAMPGLAIEEEGRLHDPGLREHFVDRVFGHARVRDFFAGRWTAESLIRFHSAEKAAVMAHDVEAARRLGRLVAGHSRLDPKQLARSYRALHGPRTRVPRPRAGRPMPSCTWLGTSRTVSDRATATSSERRSRITGWVSCRWRSRSRSCLGTFAPSEPSGRAPRRTCGRTPRSSASEA